MGERQCRDWGILYNLVEESARQVKSQLEAAGSKTGGEHNHGR